MKFKVDSVVANIDVRKIAGDTIRCTKIKDQLLFVYKLFLYFNLKTFSRKPIDICV